MTSRALLLAWAVGGVLFALLLIAAVVQWNVLATDAMRMAGERRRLTDELRLRDEQLLAAMGAHRRDLGRMLWSPGGGEPGAFLTRLGELAGAARLKVVAVGPLERQVTPQFTKSWHAIQVAGAYRDIRELAARVEAERGSLEDVRVEPAVTPAAGPSDGATGAELQARFRMTALELSPPAQRLLDRVLAAGPASSAPTAGTPPSAGAGTDVAAAPITRDPFSFVGRGPAPRTAPPAAAAVDRPPVALHLSAIMSVPGGNLAVINNQIVTVGDTVAGHRVETIREQSVTVREPGAPPRTLDLPELGAAPPAPPRR